MLLKRVHCSWPGQFLQQNDTSMVARATDYSRHERQNLLVHNVSASQQILLFSKAQFIFADDQQHKQVVLKINKHSESKAKRKHAED